ncbi:uncharacterized protein LOC131949406 isoform X2 [Physella acuta]|uniref:uncharacterized protein LOC131949406 isoform X2 n=1 Tax=Physella acuta TaxID=109671 RepID=UPI0027DC6545|nr:uncharacterized protein LOC131949406 isoform X2 [Physella acuta]
MDTHSGLPSSASVVSLANNLLAEFNIPRIIEEISDISASLFVVLYESLFSDKLPGIIRNPTTKEDNIKNCQTVIDVLSTDVVKDNLSHIRGSDIVQGDVTAISNLLDIFQCLLEYVINKIETDFDNNDTRSVNSVEVRTLAQKNRQDTPHKNLQTKSKKKSHSLSNSNNQNSKRVYPRSMLLDSSRAASLNKNDNRKIYEDHTIIAHEDYFAMTQKSMNLSKSLCPPSPIIPDPTLSLLEQKDIDLDSDAEKLLENSFVLQRAQPDMTWRNSLSAADCLHREPILEEKHAGLETKSSYENNTEANFQKSKKTEPCTERIPNAFSSSLPLRRDITVSKKQNTSTIVGPINHHKYATVENSAFEKPVEMKDLSSTYKDLQNMVEKTAAMTRLAVKSNPLRFSNGSNTIKDYQLSEEIHEKINKNPCQKDKDKHVVFASSKTRLPDRYSDELETAQSMCTKVPDLKSNILLDSIFRQLENRRQIPEASNGKVKKVTDKPNGKTKKPAKSLICKRKSALETVRVCLNEEDQAIRKKHNVLRKFYEKDNQEFTDDVDYVIGRDLQNALITEEEFIKQCKDRFTKKNKKKSKGTLPSSTFKKSRITFKSKPRQTYGKESTFSLKDGEDMVPFLLEEFPHLNLSEHTWHELWRKGLQQIETLTKTYQESQHKKSRAQNQIENASARHQLLVDALRKQMEHTKRLREIREQKKLQAQMKNSIHEKRIQSARARRYYNEYQVRARAKQLKRRTKEEVVFKELFNDALKIQKERLKDIRQYAKDQRQRQEENRQNEIDSMENFYRDQFVMLAERLTNEQFETGVRDTAQQRMMERMKKELRHKMEEEIRLYQDQIFYDDEDDVHFRQIDANRVKQQLHLAS